MKITRKLLKTITGIAAGVVVASTALGVMIGSYTTYMDYYNKAQEEKAHQKYLNSLPLELLGIDASLKSGVAYYDNGRANPTADDFQVIAHFTEKGKDFDSILQSKDFSITVPETFKESGGTIQVSYTYTYEEETKEADSSSESGESSSESSEETPTEPKTITKTADVAISLTAVKLDRLVLLENPYRVYYSDAMAFDKSGMKVKAIYNDGTEKEVDIDTITIETEGLLKEGEESATVSYQEGDDKISLDVPVTVVKESEYSDGNIVSLETEGTTILNEGDLLSSAHVAVRAKYGNGNRLIVDPSTYSITGNVENASFMKNCILTIAVNTPDGSVLETRTAVKVNTSKKATETKVGGTEKTVTGRINGAKEEKESVVIEGGDSFTYTLNVPYVAKTDFTIRLANIANKAISLGKSLALSVNGIDIALNNSTMIEGTNGVYDLNDIILPDLVLKAGLNTITFTVIDNKESIAISQFDMFTMYQGQLITSLDDYMGEVASKNEIFNADLSRPVEWNNGSYGAYSHGLCTDGTYLYSTFSGWSSGNRALSVRKFDAETGNVIATSAKTGVDYVESCAGITYYDGKLILFHNGGGMSYMNVSDFVDGAKFTDCVEGEEILPFEGMKGKTIRDVYYNSGLERFAVLEGTNIIIFDKEFKQVKTFGSRIEGNYGSITRMTGTSRYILVNYSVNGNNNPTIAVYDYEGTRVGQFRIPNTVDDMGGEEYLPVPKSMNTQGITYLNGTFYFSILRFSQGAGYSDANCIMAAKLKTIDEKVVSSFSFGEYISACGEDYAVTTTANPVTSSDYGAISGTSGWHMGMATDGKYIYASASVGGNYKTKIYKLDPSTFELLESSAAFDTLLPKGEDGKNLSDDNSQLMVKDNKIYTFIYPDDDHCRVVSLSLDRFDNGTPVEEKLPFEGQTEARVRSCYYSEVTSQYAVIDDNKKLYLFNEEGAKVSSAISLKGYSGMSVASITGDDKYLYVSYRQNNQASLPVETYTLSGEYVGVTPVPGITLGNKSDGKARGYNIQSMVCFDGDFYAGVCTWEENQTPHIWKLSVDSSVFTAPKLTGIEVVSDTNRYIIGEDIRKHLTVYASYEGEEKKKKVKDFTLDIDSFADASKTSFVVTYKEGRISKDFTVTGFSVVSASGSLGDYASLKTTAEEQNLTFATTGYTGNAYCMGLATYKGYVYIATTNGEAKNTTTVSKLDPNNNYSVVASKSISHGAYAGDGSQIFVKGSELYVIPSANISPYELYKIDLDDTESGFMSESGTFTSALSEFPVKSGVGITYNASNDKYASLGSNGVVTISGYLDGEFKTIKQTNVNLTDARSISSDDNYIYVYYGKANAQTSTKVAIYNWNGSKVGDATISLPDMTGSYTDNYNIQTVYCDGSDIYAVVCSWGGANTILKVTLA